MNVNYTGTDSKVISQSEAKLIAERLNENVLLHQTDSISVQAINNEFEFTGKNGIPSAYVFNYSNGWFHEGSWNSLL